MPERRKLPEDWLYSELTSLREEMRDQHQRLRSDFNAAIERLRVDMSARADFDDETRRRIDKLQVERDVEERQIVKRSSWLALVFSAALVAVWELFKMKIFGVKP